MVDVDTHIPIINCWSGIDPLLIEEVNELGMVNGYGERRIARSILLQMVSWKSN